MKILHSIGFKEFRIQGIHALTLFSYRRFSAENSITIILFPDGPCQDTGIARREVKVLFSPCPDGFTLVDTECMCDRRLNVLAVSCNVDTRTIKREENNFLGDGNLQ